MLRSSSDEKYVQLIYSQTLAEGLKEEFRRKGGGGKRERRRRNFSLSTHLIILSAMSLFKTFVPSKGDVSSSTAVKSSVQRGMRSKLLEQYPLLAKDEAVLLESIWPKKEGITLVKFS